MRPILASLVAAALAGCGTATAATRDFPVGPFDRVSNATPFDVEVRVGGAPAVRAEGPAAALDHLQIAVVDGTLAITSRPGPWWTYGRVRQHIAVAAPGLVAATVGGPGDMVVDAPRAATFTARVTGPGSLTIARLSAATVAAALTGPGDLSIGGLDAHALSADLGGPGNITLAGHADAARLTLRGPGDIRATGLTVTDAVVGLHGPGNLAVTATRTARGELAGPGDITVRGGARCEIAGHGPGEVHC